MVSIVIPVYNVEKYLAECVNSVLAQTYTDYEVILVDDGATDSSGALCDAYAARDSRIRVIHRPNGGLSAARNTGLDAATGEYVYFLDSDDFIEPQTLEHLLRTAGQEQADVVFFDGYVFFDGCRDEGNTLSYRRATHYAPDTGRVLLSRLLQSGEYRTAVPLMLFRTDYLRCHDLRFMEGVIHEDEHFTFLVYHADGRVAHCHAPLYARRVRPASIMTAAGALHRYDSMRKIYFALSAIYDRGSEAATMYMVRTAKTVLSKYALLPAAEQEAVAARHKAFRKDVMSHHGFGDHKLKVKCAGRLGNLYYRAQGKLLRMLKK